MFHSKSTYFYKRSSRRKDRRLAGDLARNYSLSGCSYTIPAITISVLLLGTCLAFNPIGNGSVVYAADNDSSSACQNGDPVNGACVEEVGLLMNGTNAPYSEAHATDLYTDKTAYREYDFSVRAVDVADYTLYANPVQRIVGETSYTNKLVNMDDPEGSIIEALATKTVGSNIEAGYWGYALAGGNTGNLLTAAKESLEYQALPIGSPDGDTTPVDTGTETILNEDKSHNDVEYKLYFGARAKDTMRSGHYTTEVQLSLVASPKKVIMQATLGDITKMSEMTSSYCASLPTPSADAKLEDVPTGQLIDDREGDNGTKYWVSKLADGNCWMTQNMAYSGIAATTGYFNEDNKNKVLDLSKTDSDKTEAIGTRKPSDDPNTIEVLGTDGKTYNAHYRIGNYYPQNSNAAAQACDFSSKNNSYWKLPAGDNNMNNGTFRKLTNTYTITSGTSYSNSDAKLIAAPLYFLRAGYDDFNPRAVGSEGRYWSSMPYYNLYFTSSNVNPFVSYYNTLGSNYGNAGLSVRCLVLGN